MGWPAERKQGDDVFSLAAGAPGVELMLPLLHDAINERGLPLALLPRLLSEAPARRFGLWPRKGALSPGADADIVVLDPEATWVVDPTELVTPAGWSPYSGRQLRGRVRAGDRARGGGLRRRARAGRARPGSAGQAHAGP